jgi:rare lipoprotein A
MRTSAATYSEPGGYGPGLRAVFRFLLSLSALVYLVSCAAAPVGRHGYMGQAVVSWYGPGFHGKLTASGERYNMDALTCAHKTMPFGTRLKLTNVRNGHTAVVVVNDRGPFVRGRDIDVSREAARKLGIIGTGTGRVRVHRLGRDMRYSKYVDGGVVGAPGFNGPYTVQVGAFVERANAEHVKIGLQLNHKKVYMIVKWVDGTRFFRVRVGKFRDEGNAGRYARRLAEEGYEARVVPFEKKM